jgi:sugar lactone lactonase YvrE
MHDNKVYAINPDHSLETILTLEDDEPSGLGWLTDGTMLIVSMRKRKLLALRKNKLSEFADLSQLATYHCNDMVTDDRGRSYVGNFGFDLHSNGDFQEAELILVHPNGKVEVAASDLAFPNGTVITPNGETLIIAESLGEKLTAFDINPNGSLTNRRIWAKMKGFVPDGICLDKAGGVWVASPVSNEVIRVVEGGRISDQIRLKKQAYACMLGGRMGKTLFIMTSDCSNPDDCKLRKSAAVEFAEVKYPAAGYP